MNTQWNNDELGWKDIFPDIDEFIHQVQVRSKIRKSNRIYPDKMKEILMKYGHCE
jgi:hypothetical protein